MTRHFLGIDIGGTKSHALIANEQGRAVGFGDAGAGSYEIVGWEGLRETLHLVTGEALGSAGLDKGDLAGMAFGVAGYDWPSNRPGHVEAIASLGISAIGTGVRHTCRAAVTCLLSMPAVVTLFAGPCRRWAWHGRCVGRARA
ncbi:MAG: hypothetical protein MUF84_19900 [Anaerolineae bacterium]|nr:hypothetical protein [Anaerolineae bacterium]